MADLAEEMEKRYQLAKKYNPWMAIGYLEFVVDQLRQKVTELETENEQLQQKLNAEKV